MKKRRNAAAYAVAVLGLYVSGAGAQDVSTINNPHATAPTQTPSSMPPPSPILGWTAFRGKVTHIDLQNKMVQIRENDTDILIEVPVNQNVSIYKQGRHKYALGDIQEGDHITLRNNETS